MLSNPPTPSPRPLKDLVKAADEALTRSIDASHQKNGVSRIEWLVLHAVEQGGAATIPELMAALHHSAALEEVPAVLERLFDGGWFEEQHTAPRGVVRLRLSPQGQTRHATLVAAVEEVCRRGTAGIAAGDEAAMVRALERLVSNLTTIGPTT